MTPCLTTALGALYNGDCLELMRDMPADSVDLVMTDPPYSSGGAFRGDRMNSTATKYIDNTRGFPEFMGDNRDQRGFAFWCAMWLSLCYRLMKTGAIIGIFTDWRQLPTISDVLQAGGFVWRGIAVWDKTEAVRPQKGRYRNQCEYIVWGTKGPRATEGIVLPGVYRQVVMGSQKLHITEKPVEVMKYLVSIEPEGATVLDPFIGSGQTAAACEDLNRRWIGIELSPAICEIARKRLKDQTTQLTIHGNFSGVSPSPATQQNLPVF